MAWRRSCCPPRAPSVEQHLARRATASSAHRVSHASSASAIRGARAVATRALARRRHCQRAAQPLAHQTHCHHAVGARDCPRTCVPRVRSAAWIAARAPHWSTRSSTTGGAALPARWPDEWPGSISRRTWYRSAPHSSRSRSRPHANESVGTIRPSASRPRWRCIGDCRSGATWCIARVIRDRRCG